MWKHYSKDYLLNNRVSSFSIMAATFIATLFLSLLCCLGYNFWAYEIGRIVFDEGDWHGRIVADIEKENLSAIENFANVESVVFNEALSEDVSVYDVYFEDMRTIYRDMPLIIAYLGLEQENVEYHSLLLSRYFIHDPKDEEPPLLLSVYLGILIMMSCSFILIIRNSFELSMNARVHQFGIFLSVGATPRQVRMCLMQEAAALCVIPICLGTLAGAGMSVGVIKLINFYAADVPGRQEATFQYHVAVFVITIFTSLFTALCSAWVPARKLSKMTPLQAIRGTSDVHLKKTTTSCVLGYLFGIEGELAGNAQRAQRKALRVSNLSLVLSFLGFSMILCLTTLSGISTRHTYFGRYQDAWDVMITVKDVPIEEVELIKDLGEIPDVKDVAIYQKVKGITPVAIDSQSDVLAELGGFERIAGKESVERKLQVDAPIVILDDDTFLRYCVQIGIAPSIEGSIVLNRIWDNVNSNFRYKTYIPFVKEDSKTTILLSENSHDSYWEVPVLAYTQEVPVLREEYDNYSLVHFISCSMWADRKSWTESTEENCYIRIFSTEEASLETLKSLEKNAVELLAQSYEVESENRIQEKLSNDEMIIGMQVIFGSFCGLLGIIGIANVFLNTLGFVRHRKREFAQYMSMGLTPSGMKKIFFVEGLIMAGKPLLITIPCTVVCAEFAIKASYLDSMEFWREAPVAAMFIFAGAIVGFVSIAYVIGGKRLLRCELSEVLRNDALN